MGPKKIVPIIIPTDIMGGNPMASGTVTFSGGKIAPRESIATPKNDIPAHAAKFTLPVEYVLIL